MFDIESGKCALRDHGAKITMQRLAIMHALVDRTDHPSADTIYCELKPRFPKLSIATLYSTLRLLASASLIRVLTIDDKRLFFDPDTSPHGHFMCTSCKKLFDVPVDFDGICAPDSMRQISSITSGELFLYGTCAQCAA